MDNFIFDDADFASLLGGKRPEATFVMDLLPGVVGWIIGRSGTRIKEIQIQSGCKMWVDQDVPDDQPRKLFFHGSAQGIECAVNLVNKLLLAAPNLAGKHGAIKKLHSNIVDCPADLVGLLIGKKGWTIKKIQLESGAQISINQSVREGQPRKIIVSGMQASVELATRLIEEVLRNKPEDEEMNELLYNMTLNGRTPGSEPLNMPQLAINSGGMYTASGQLAPEYMSPNPNGGTSSWETDELSRQSTLVRGNEMIYMQSYPSVISTQLYNPQSLASARNSAFRTSSSNSLLGDNRKPSAEFDFDSFRSQSGVDAIFDTRRRSGSDPNERDSSISLPLETSNQLGERHSLDEEHFMTQQPMRRLSTGSINPAHIVGLGMGFGTADGHLGMSSGPMTSLYSRPDVYARDAEDTIARQLQQRALHKQRILQLQQEQKEKQMASLKIQQQQQQQQQLMAQFQKQHQQQQQIHQMQMHQQQQQQSSSPKRDPGSISPPPTRLPGAMQQQQPMYFQHLPRHSVGASSYTDDLSDAAWLAQANQSSAALAHTVAQSYNSSNVSGYSTPHNGSFMAAPPGLGSSGSEPPQKRSGSFSASESLFK